MLITITIRRTQTILLFSIDNKEAIQLVLHISRDKWINFLSTVLNLFAIRCVIAVIWQYLNTAVMISLLFQFGCVFLWSGIIAINANSLQGSNASETVVKSVQKRWLPRYPYNSEFAVRPQRLSGPD